MSTRKVLERHSLIIRKLQRQTADFKKIKRYLEIESEIQGYDFRISKRTFQRDIRDIESLYGIQIKYDRQRHRYYIDFAEQDEFSRRVLDAYITFNALKLNERLSKYIHFEKRKASGTDFFLDLLKAIENRKKVKFSYQKFWGEQAYEVELAPLALKEFRERWYLLVQDSKDLVIKSFGLDRMKNLQITKNSFVYPKGFDVYKYYKYCFGITGPNNRKPQEIVLSFTPIQGKYIKSLPLHQTQKILVDNAEELQIKLTLIPTFEFFMELLSHGDTLKVLKPESLKKKVYRKLENTLLNYKD